jgi:hypothetical protein
MVGCPRRNMYPFVRQFVKPFPLYLRKAWWLHLYLPVALRFVAFAVEKKTPSWEIQSIKEDTASCVVFAIF